MTMQPQPPSPGDRSTTFQAVEGNQAEQYSGATLLVVAYSALWIILFAWVAIVWRKQSALGERLGDLEKVIAESSRTSETRDAAPKKKDA
jgi:hypothetical protein